MRFISSLFILVASVFSIVAQTKPVDFAELEKTIETEIKDKKVPGAAVAIVSGDKIIFAKGFGTTNIEGGSPVTADTLFRMGSTTKMFTAATLVSLAVAGKVKMDEPIGAYIKNLPPKVSQLTAHRLLSQSSGLRDFGPLASGNDDAALGQNIALWKDDVFFTDPNKIYSYSSANYWLAGYLAEAINGKPYSDTMAELVLRLLGMTRSTVRSFEAMTYPLAIGHDVKDGSAVVIRPIDNNAAKYPGGSMYSSANELSRFAIAMLNGGKIEGKQALSPMVVEQLQKPQFYLPGEEKAFYGYGLLGFDEQGIKTVSHGGAARGYGSMIMFAPEQKIAVIILASTSGQTLSRTKQKAMQMLLPVKPQTNQAPTTTTVNADEMKRYVGKYTHAPQTWEAFIKDGKLYFKEDGKDFELKKTGKDNFSYDQGEVLFVPNDKGEIEHIFMGLYAAKKVS